MSSSRRDNLQPESTSSYLEHLTRGEYLREYRDGRRERDSLELQDWVDPIIESDGKLSLKFTSGLGAHYITSSSGSLVAVYVGPSGAENRPAQVDQDTVSQLISRAEDVSVALTEETSLSDSIVADLL